MGISSRAWQPAIIMLLPPLFWAGNFTVGRAIGHLGVPVSLSFWRWHIALLFLLPFVVRPMWRARTLIRQHFAALALLALLSVTAFNTLAYIGLQHTSANNATLMNSFVPAWVLMISVIFMGETLRRRQLFGLGVSMLGIFAIVSRMDLHVLDALDFNEGDLWMLVATFIWAVYSALLKKIRPETLDALPFLGVQMVLGALMLWPLMLWNPLNEAGLPWNQTTAAILFYVAIFPSIIAYLAWNFGMKQLGPTVGSQFIHFTPVFGALFSAIFLGEHVHLYHLTGGLCILGGIWLSLGSKPIARP